MYYKYFLRIATVFVICATFIVTMQPQQFAHAATLTVTNINDSGAGSLRDTINLAANGDTVTFAPALAGTTITVTTTLNINKNLTIQGLSPTLIRVSGGGTTQIFRILPGTTVLFTDLIIADGKTVSGGAGGVVNEGTLTLTNVKLLNNQGMGISGPGDGGAIYNTGTLSMTGTTISNNYNADAAAISNRSGTLTITQSTISNNTGFMTGGIDSQFDGANVTITNSLFNGNTGILNGAIENGGTSQMTITDSIISNNSVTVNNYAAYYAGGINNNGTLRIARTTVSGNIADGNQGVIVGAIANFGTLAVVNSTIAKNTGQVNSVPYTTCWPTPTLCPATTVGGIYNFVGSVYLTNTTIASNDGMIRSLRRDNTATFGAKNTIISADSGTNCNAALTTNDGNNLQYPDASCGSGIPVADPLLGVLANNGGFSKTMALSIGSPAIDAGDNTTCAGILVGGIDQRQNTRPIDGDGNGSAVCDIGAYEAPVPPPPTRTPLPPRTGPTSTPTATATIVPTIAPSPTNTQPPIHVIPTNTLSPIRPTPLPVPNGLTGYYFNNADFTAMVFSRIDPAVNFSWGVGSPDIRIGADTFSVRWTGKLVPQYSQVYTFYINADDGVRLWVNSVKIIDNWISTSGERTSIPITLTAGMKYAIQLDYFENISTASAILSWSSASQPKQIIPSTRLFTR